MLIADDSDVYRAALHRFVSGQPGIEVVGCVSDGPSAIDAAASCDPDIVLLDLCMPGLDGIESTRALSRSRGKVIAISAQRSPERVRACIEAGASAFMHKARAADDLPELIRFVAKGGTHSPPQDAVGPTPYGAERAITGGGRGVPPQV